MVSVDVRLFFIIVIAVGIVATAVAVIIVSAIPTQDYAMEVDALKDEQSLFVHARVMVKNIGREPLTNVVVDYGGRQEPPIAVMQPGERRDFSPPEGSDLLSVTVTADNGIAITKEFRAPIKLPGMIGS